MGDGHGRREHEQRSGQNALDPSDVEVLERDPAGAAELAHKDPGDQEPGEDVEHVHSDETTERPLEEVIDDDGEHCDGTQSIQITSPRMLARL
ncbi:hypothetical protein HQQ81_11740 [Microbacteriaceae bacterium VKM Ac-2854]|nr:hypothetical protein [Microbacteriaceae bacterium VKM Ac-2854]